MGNVIADIDVTVLEGIKHALKVLPGSISAALHRHFARMKIGIAKGNHAFHQANIGQGSPMAD
ncbi:hypothetical protein D3C86_2163330 [compost metagenome]